MGYEATWTGEIRITPPLAWGEIKNSKARGLQDLHLHLDENAHDTPTGRITTITAERITPRTSSPYNGYDIQNELQSLIDNHRAHDFTGTIEAYGPDGDHWRYIVRDRHVIRQTAQLVWRDEDDQ